MKYRRVIAEILVVSVFLQIFAIVTPLMFQIVIDRVLAEQRLSTLYVVVGTLTVVSLLEVVMGGLRTHAMNHTAGRIDAELGGKLCGWIEFHGAGAQNKLTLQTNRGSIHFAGGGVRNIAKRLARGANSHGNIYAYGVGASNEFFSNVHSGDIHFQGAGAYNSLHREGHSGNIYFKGAGGGNTLRLKTN